MINFREKLSEEFDPDAVEWVLNYAKSILNIDDELPVSLSDTETAMVCDVKPATVQVWRCTGNHSIQYTKAGRNPRNNTLSVLRVLLESGHNKKQSQVAAWA